MALQHEPDVSVADWWVEADVSWDRLCTQGPPGFPRCGRLFHALPEGEAESDRSSLENVEGDLGDDQLLALIAVLAGHTTTPGDCFFGLWDGFGDLYGSPAVAVLSVGRRAPKVPAAFPPSVLDGPRITIPGRDYPLFRGPLARAGEWGAADLLPGRPRRINSPNLMWPADRSWFVATEIDQPWTGICGSPGLLADLLSAADLDVEATDYEQPPPYWREPE